MAILIECPRCRKRHGEKQKKKKPDGSFELVTRSKCSCGFALKKASGKVYWIEYYFLGDRKRERIGPNRAAAEHREREVLSRRAEGAFIKKKSDPYFDELADWYKKLDTVKAKKSYNRDLQSIEKLSAFFAGKRVSEITANSIESYRIKRRSEESFRKHKTRPATINREVACLRRILYLARDEKGIDVFAFKKIKPLDEQNIRNRILTDKELENLLAALPPHTWQIVVFANLTAMRKGEILGLTWDKVDLEGGFVHLNPEDTKTNEGRSIPLDARLIEMLKALPRSDDVPNVFLWRGKPIKDIRKSFSTARKKAAVKDFTFHDFRHMCINNWRLHGHDYFRIMAASGHRTMSVFKRYNVVTKEELKALVQTPPTPISTAETTENK
ncbi:MAG: site-specific integrase [Syntrophales bacterium]|nr:site-specific integrase [Syntrophales bacterium]